MFKLINNIEFLEQNGWTCVNENYNCLIFLVSIKIAVPEYYILN